MGGGLSTGKSVRQHDYRYGHAPDDDTSASNTAVCTWVGKTLDLPPKPVNIDTHFQIHSVLGTGMLGRVRLLQHKKTKKYYALKSMKKADVMAQTMLKYIDNEREALNRLTKLHHPFLAKYFGSIQSPNHVHFVLEYAPGGELLHRLHQVGKFSQEEAKFYTTELVAFVSFLHTQGYMYRDLKPENVLLDARGHIKVVDLGFVRRFADRGERCTTSVGTPQYLAPEQLTQSKEKRNYTCIVDWWALACMLFEMVAGKTPFVSASGNGKDESPFTVYMRIIQGKIQWPSGLSSSLKDLLRQMLASDPAKRLCDAESIKQHAWFSNVDWQEVLHADVTPPFQPMLKIEGDRSCFDEYPDERDDAFSSSKDSASATTFANEFRNF